MNFTCVWDEIAEELEMDWNQYVRALNWIAIEEIAEDEEEGITQDPDPRILFAVKKLRKAIGFSNGLK